MSKIFLLPFSVFDSLARRLILPAFSWLIYVPKTIAFSNLHLTFDPLPAALNLDQKAALESTSTSNYCFITYSQLFPFNLKALLIFSCQCFSFRNCFLLYTLMRVKLKVLEKKILLRK